MVTDQTSNKKWSSAKDVDTNVSNMLSHGESLYTIDEHTIRNLQPCTILTQNICSVCAVDLVTVERLATDMEPIPSVISLDPNGLRDVIDDIAKVGLQVGLEKEAGVLVRRLNQRISIARSIAENAVASSSIRPSVGFIEWPDPIYVGGHWTPQMIHAAGGTHPLNIPARGDNGSPQNKAEEEDTIGEWGHAGKSFAIENADFAASDPDWIVVAPCGLNLEASEREARALFAGIGFKQFAEMRAVREGRVVVVDGDAMFNRPGPR
jgi:ABC-type Fe3+-hydroxamate transport system substrate-binding protein